MAGHFAFRSTDTYTRLPKLPGPPPAGHETRSSRSHDVAFPRLRQDAITPDESNGEPNAANQERTGAHDEDADDRDSGERAQRTGGDHDRANNVTAGISAGSNE